VTFRPDAQTGGVAAELVIVTPLLILFLLFVVALGRLAGSRIDLDGAANQAARAASIARDPVAATSAARTTASAVLAGAHISCAHLAVTVDVAEFHPGGSVAVTIACTVELEDVTGLRLPSAKTLTARGVAPLDRYRGLGP